MKLSQFVLIDLAIDKSFDKLVIDNNTDIFKYMTRLYFDSG